MHGDGASLALVEEAHLLTEGSAKILVAQVASEVEGDISEQGRVDVSQDESSDSDVDVVKTWRRRSLARVSCQEVLPREVPRGDAQEQHREFFHSRVFGNFLHVVVGRIAAGGVVAHQGDEFTDDEVDHGEGDTRPHGGGDANGEKDVIDRSAIVEDSLQKVSLRLPEIETLQRVRTTKLEKPPSTSSSPSSLGDVTVDPASFWESATSLVAETSCFSVTGVVAIVSQGIRGLSRNGRRGVERKRRENARDAAGKRNRGSFRTCPGS